MAEFVDTNVFIRLLSSDDPEKYRRCLALFKRAQRGDLQLMTSELVVAEVVYVLSSPTLYKLPRSEVSRLLRPILALPGLKLEHKRSFFSALDLYERSNLDFEDCLSVAHVQRSGLGALYSYDRGFDRVAGLRRLEP